MSSIALDAAQEIAAALKTKGVAMLDAPVSGGEPKAIDGSLAIMVGGDAKDFDSVGWCSKRWAARFVHVGDIGAGNVTKLANQIIVALNIAAVAEAFVLATKAGVDPKRYSTRSRAASAGSTVMNAKVPMILNGDFNPGGRVELHTGDLQNVLDTGHRLNVPLPLTAGVMEVLQALISDGMRGLTIIVPSFATTKSWRKSKCASTRPASPLSLRPKLCARRSHEPCNQ